MRKDASLFSRFREASFPWPALLVAAGLGLRIFYVDLSQTAPPRPDLGSFLAPALSLEFPYDTSPREPLYVWWLWGLSKAGLAGNVAIRLGTAFWYVPSALLLLGLARRLLGRRTALAVLALYSFLPVQIVSDTVGERHVVETTLVLLLLRAALASGALSAFLLTAASYAGLVLIRLNYAVSGAALAAWIAVRRRRPRLLLALIPAALLLLPHFRDNRRKFGDPLMSVNIHSYWFANKEFIGRPGFHATYEEWEKDAFRPSLTYRQWAFEAHGPAEYLKETARGYVRCLWHFFANIYFAHLLPSAARWVLVFLYLAGFVRAWIRPELRLVAAGLSFLVLPFAFVSHVFMASRFFVPFSPLVLLLVGAGGRWAAAASIRGWARLGPTPPA